MGAYAAVAAIGALVGIAELVERYRDEPLALLRVASAWAYVVLNMGAAIGALWAINVFGWFGGQADALSVTTLRVVAAGTGAMFILRSSFYNTTKDGALVGVGFNVILMALLGAADRGVDRVRVRSRAHQSAQIMAGISFEKARTALSTYCLALMQNASAAEQQKLRASIEALDGRDDLTDSQKALTLGVLLMNMIGPKALTAAVEVLRPELAAASAATNVEAIAKTAPEAAPA